MKLGKIEKRILQEALEQFRKTTNLNIEVRVDDAAANRRPNTIIRLTLDNLHFDFETEVKNTLTRGTVGAAIEQMRILPGKGIIITRYVTPQLADILKKADVPFIDTAGNAYINKQPLFLFIKGNRPVEKHRRERPTRAFQTRGLQVVFALLCNPGLERAPYREIAKLADVALGTVGWVINDLKKLGFLIDMGRRGRRLTQKEDLLRRWATAYPEMLRPKIFEGRYRAQDIDWWKHTEPPHRKAYWGGEIAAAEVTGYLKPEIVTVYTQDIRPIGDWLIMNRIRKAPEGNIEILHTFWDFKCNWGYTNLVHPILIYADLLATADARNIEAARMLYDQELTRFVREDR